MSESPTTYWRIVLRSLTDLFGKSADDVLELIGRYRERVRNGPEYLREEMVYHFEPFRLATMLAGKKGDEIENSEDYRKIVADALRESTVTGVQAGEYQLAD